jgi:hypothetical protein
MRCPFDRDGTRPVGECMTCDNHRALGAGGGEHDGHQHRRVARRLTPVPHQTAGPPSHVPAAARHYGIDHWTTAEAENTITDGLHPRRLDDQS